jgi:hypothetical protein
MLGEQSKASHVLRPSRAGRYTIQPGKGHRIPRHPPTSTLLREQQEASKLQNETKKMPLGINMDYRCEDASFWASAST